MAASGRRVAFGVFLGCCSLVAWLLGVFAFLLGWSEARLCEDEPSECEASLPGQAAVVTYICIGAGALLLTAAVLLFVKPTAARQGHSSN
jgi:hypothetical protein